MNQRKKLTSFLVIFYMQEFPPNYMDDYSLALHKRL